MRPPGYETLDRNGAGRLFEYAALGDTDSRQAADIGRPPPWLRESRGRRDDWHGQGYGRGWRPAEAAADADVELMRMRLRMLELDAR